MDIKFNKEEGIAIALDENKRIGEITFSPSEGLWIIDHTGVNPEYGGQGIGKKLVAKVVEEARRENVKILPLCPFAAAEFKKHEEYSDVLKDYKK